MYITHEELVNTNIRVGPDHLGNMNANIIMNQIADVGHSNNFIPTNAHHQHCCHTQHQRFKTQNHQ